MSNKNRRGGLGRGLGALIPTAPPAPSEVHSSTNGVEHASSTEVRELPAPVAPAADTAADTAADAGHETGTDYVDDGAAATTTVVPDDAPATGSVPEDEETTLAPVAGAQYAEVPVDLVHANAKQPRQVFDEDALAELTHSVREFGILQPVVVRPDDQGYELVMGERRLRAAVAAGLATIPAIVRTTSDDAMLRDALLENIHRAQLNPLEEAAAYQQLLEEFGVTHDELAQRIGRSRPQISNTIRLLNLPVPVQRRVAAGVISAGHARALLGLDDAEVQEDLAARIVAEGLSVRATEELVALHQHGHGPTKTQRRSNAPRITAPAISELADKLSDTFDTRVRVDIGRRKGKITVEFASVDDLERIVAVMAPSLATRRQDDADTPNEL
jgi:ParB family chromosome partitioning protein